LFAQACKIPPPATANVAPAAMASNATAQRPTTTRQAFHNLFIANPQSSTSEADRPDIPLAAEILRVAAAHGTDVST
jgi:hypothetical protein